MFLKWKCTGGIDCIKGDRCYRWNAPTKDLNQKFKDFSKSGTVKECSFFIGNIDSIVEGIYEEKTPKKNPE